VQQLPEYLGGALRAAVPGRCYQSPWRVVRTICPVSPLPDPLTRVRQRR
jgi:hypothetical protein